MVFYCVNEVVQMKWMRAWRDESLQLPLDDIMRGKSRLNEPLEFDIVVRGGEKMPDFLNANLLPVLSPRMCEVLASVDASGYYTHPVILRHPLLGVAVHGYEALIVTGKGGPFDEAKSSAEYSPEDPETLMHIRGWYMQEDQWDGSDVFCIREKGLVFFVTERVADALQKARPSLRNLVLTPNNRVFF